MNKPSSPDPIGSLKKVEWTPQRIKMAAIFALLLVVYLLLRPWLSSALGIELPGLFPDHQVAPVDPQKPAGDSNSDGQIADTGSRGKSGVELPGRESTSKPTTTPTTPNSSSDSITTGTEKPAIGHPPTTPATGTKPRESNPEISQPQPVLGELTDVGRGALKSTAGLIYHPTRNEHRVEHVLLHAVDDPGKPVHGVFEGKREEILALIDEAYLLAQQARPQTVTIEEERDRTVYTVDMGRKIGYMGGEAGKRKRFPPCKHLQIVLEGTEVITAYPVIPR